MKLPIVFCLLVVSPLVAVAESGKSPAGEKQETAVVGGQVRRPGPVVVQGKTTLYAAIQAAGGPTEFGAMRRVKVIRDGKTTVYDLRKDEAKLVEVEPDDTIEVPQKNWFGR